MTGTNFDPSSLNETQESRASRTETTNEAGGQAWEPDDGRVSLYKNVLNNLLEDTYYQDASELFEDVVEEYLHPANAGGEFPLQLATYARHEGGYRDISQVLLVLAANYGRRELKADVGDGSTREAWNRTVNNTPTNGDLIADYAPSIIDRTDEFNTVVSLQLQLFGKPIPRPLRRGIENALHKKYFIVEFEDGPTERLTYIETEDSDNEWGRFAEALHYGIDNGIFEMDDDLTVVPERTALHDEGYVHDSYTAAKYLQKNHEVSLIDVIRLVRPNPRSDNRDTLFERLVRGEPEMDDHDVEPLRNERTWEAQRSDDEDDRSEAEQWRDSLEDMGLMARVRNVRNMRRAGLSGSEIFDYDAPDGRVFGEESRRRVQDHQQFPFRYYQALKALDEASGFWRTSGDPFAISGDLVDDWTQEWLNEAIDASVENLPDRFESTFTAVDLSGSMNSTISGESDMARAEIATLFGAVVTKYGGDVGAFGSNFEVVDVDEQARQGMGSIDLAREIYKLNSHVGNSTNGFKALEWATRNGIEYDRFVFFTDEQLWDSTTRRVGTSLKEVWDEYRQRVNPDAHLYIVDLASYGSFSTPQDYQNVHQISGWHSEIISFIDETEGIEDTISEIATIEPGEY